MYERERLRHDVEQLQANIPDVDARDYALWAGEGRIELRPKDSDFAPFRMEAAKELYGLGYEYERTEDDGTAVFVRGEDGGDSR